MAEAIAQTNQVPDIILINKIIGGEKRLFELIIRRYNQRLFRIGLSVLHNDIEAEDAMQATYVKAYEHLSQFENRSSFNTWLTKIMLNECLAMKMKKQRTFMQNESQLDKESQFVKKEFMSTPAHLLMNKELSNALENAIAHLPEKYRLVFILREIEDMSVKETSEALEIKETNVKVRLNRAKTMLREHLNDFMKDNVYVFHLSRCNRMVENVFRQLQIN